MKVSNANVNVDKTIAFPLSGKNKSAWVNFLNNHNISPWCDQQSDIPLSYLDFSMIMTTEQ